MIPIPAFWYRLSRGRRVVFLVGVLVLLALGISWVSRGAVSEEERVKGVVLQAIHAAEDESIDGIAEAFSPAYRGIYGNDYNDLLNRVRRDFSLISDLRIRVKQWNIAIQGNSAVVDIKFRFRLNYDKIGPYSNVPMDQFPNTPENEDDQAHLVLANDGAAWRIVELKVSIPEH